MVILIVLSMSARPCSVMAHPHNPFEIVSHEHPALGLIITIESGRVVYDVSLSNGFLNTLVPQERGFLKLRLEENTFVFLDANQEAAERKSLAEFFSSLPPIKINGVESKPQFEGFKFVRSSESANRQVSDVLPPDARISVSFPTKDEPEKVELFWNIFADAYSVDAFGQPIDASLAARLDTRTQSRIITFTKDQPAIEWESPQAPADMRIAAPSVKQPNTSQAIPLLSIALCMLGLFGGWMCRGIRRPRLAQSIVVLVAAAAAFQLRTVGQVILSKPQPPSSVELAPETATTVFDSLLKNIYRAFDFRNESDVYDVLAQSVDGRLLDSVYKEVQSGLVSAEQNGAIAKIKSVEVLESELVSKAKTTGDSFEVRGNWRVEGMVYHWGHVHDTSNIFEAIYTVAPRDGFWKIIKTELLSAEPET